MDKVPLINRISKTDSSDVLHTSGYARVQNGDNIGADSTQSFSERQAIERRRQYVRKYRDSRLGANFHGRRSIGNSRRPYDVNAINTEKSNSNNIKLGNVNTNPNRALPQFRKKW